MNSKKFDHSILFLDQSGRQHFLFQLINVGKNADEFKFIFMPPHIGLGGAYTESRDVIADSDIIATYSEVDYHNDGSVLFKFPGNKGGDPTRYRNPAGNQVRRTPPAQLREWEPIIRYTVVDYDLCKTVDADNPLMLPENALIFNGDPFVCVILAGHMVYANPPNNRPSEMIYRVNDVGTNIDLVLWIYKTDYRGRVMRVGKSDLTVFSRSNVIEVVEEKR